MTLGTLRLATLPTEKWFEMSQHLTRALYALLLSQCNVRTYQREKVFSLNDITQEKHFILDFKCAGTHLNL